jgi:hypothetical protein
MHKPKRKNGETLLPQNEVASIANLIMKHGVPGKSYLYQQFWKEFVYPSDLKWRERGIRHETVSIRKPLREGIDQCMSLARSDYRLHCIHGKGFRLTDHSNNGIETMIEKAFIKVTRIAKTGEMRITDLADSIAMPSDKVRILAKAAKMIGENVLKGLIADVIGDRTLPREQRMEIANRMMDIAEIENAR